MKPLIPEKTIIKCFISTGQKRVLHTLWIQSIGPGFCTYNYQRNLSADEKTAIEQAKEFCGQGGYEWDGIMDSPCFKKANHIEAFGIKFKHKRRQGKEYYYGFPTEEFWKEWKENKEQLKQSGFSVTKHQSFEDVIKYGNDALYTWYVFYRPQEN